MRLSHRELEQARADAFGYLRERLRGQQFGGRVSAFRLWQSTVNVFHRENQRLVIARRHLEDAWRRSYVAGPAQQRRLIEFLQHLHRYADAFSRLNHTVVSTRVRVRLSLLPNLDLGGEVSRIDLTPDGYSACLFARNRPPHWRDQLRMPLIQRITADRFGVSTRMVAVGFYDLESADHDWHSFTDAEISETVDEATRVAHNLIAAAAQVGYPI